MFHRIALRFALPALALPALTAHANETQLAIVNRLRAAVPVQQGDGSLYDRNADGGLDTGDAIRALITGTPTPSPTVTATPTATATATPTVTPTATPTSSLQEARLAQQSVGTAYDAGSFATNVVELAVRAAFLASELNGAPAITGTLTATDSSNNNFTYSTQPTDRLVIVSFDGRRREIKFTALSGDDSSADNLIAQHNMTFTYFEQGRQNLTIVSAKGYTRAARAWTAAWQRTITGTFLSAEETVTLNLQHNGNESGSIEPGFTQIATGETYSGSCNSPSATVTVNEGSTFLYIQNSNQGVVVQNKSLTSNSTSTFGGATYAFQNVYARWEQYSLLSDPGQFNVVKDAGYWQSSGSVQKNGVLWGTAGFDGPVVVGTKGPNFVLTLQGSGEKLLLHTLIPDL